MIWEEIKEWGPLYALGGLDPGTARIIEDYLRDATPEQQREIEEWHEIVGFLPLALPAPRVREGLRRGLLGRISQESLSTPTALDQPPPRSGTGTTLKGPETGSYKLMDAVIAQSDVSSTITATKVVNHAETYYR
ncbi:MAG TPA: hypothetical protein VJ302_07135 [Blastocatellia bacterium]|nr:hypothetical protein [Blastocatellia bacterium]